MLDYLDFVEDCVGVYLTDEGDSYMYAAKLGNLTRDDVSMRKGDMCDIGFRLVNRLV